MRLSHTLGRTSVAFDDPNLVSAGGLLPVLALAQAAGLRELADEHLSVPTDKGANAGLKVASLVAGMVAGAVSIDDMALLRHGGMCRVFARAYAPSTLGSFLRAFTFGHVRQLDAIASRFLRALAGRTRLPGEPARAAAGGTDAGDAFVDVDGTIIARWRTCPPGSSTRTRPGSCWPSSRSTSLVSPRPWPGPSWPKQPAQRSGASSSASRLESRPPPDGSPFTCPTGGLGKTPGPDCATASPTHPSQPRPDHRARKRRDPKEPTWNTPGSEAGRSITPAGRRFPPGENHPAPGSQSVDRG